MQEGDGRRFLGRRRDREEACFICGHYHDIENGEPCSVCGHVLTVAVAGREVAPPAGVLPTGVIPGELYLGSYDTASRSELLKTMGITHILNTVPSCQTLFKNTFSYHTVSSSPPDIKECFDFIESVRKRGGKVLVFCMSGVSRSPTVVIAYLMLHRQWRLAESYKWVKDKRPSVNIGPEDSKRLADLELQLHNSCSVPVNGLSALYTSGLTGDLFSQPPATCSLQVAPVAQPSSSPAPSENGLFGRSSWTMPSTAASQPITFGSINGGTAGGTGGDGRPVFVFGTPPAVAATAVAAGTTDSEMET